LNGNNKFHGYPSNSSTVVPYTLTYRRMYVKQLFANVTTHWKWRRSELQQQNLNLLSTSQNPLPFNITVCFIQCFPRRYLRTLTILSTKIKEHKQHEGNLNENACYTLTHLQAICNLCATPMAGKRVSGIM